ncbi:hypothetical protein L9F63_010741, partial [Diploptera punctata]
YFVSAVDGKPVLLNCIENSSLASDINFQSQLVNRGKNIKILTNAAITCRKSNINRADSGSETNSACLHFQNSSPYRSSFEVMLRI